MGRYRTFETEKDEKSYEARIWWVFWIVAVVVMCYTLWHQFIEYDLIHNGSFIDAEYYVYNGRELARYRDENNVNYSFSLEGLDAIHDENTVRLYYKGNIALATPRRSPKTWIFAYVVFGAMFIVCSRILWKIYHRKHSE